MLTSCLGASLPFCSRSAKGVASPRNQRYLHPGSWRAGMLFRAEVQDSGKVANKIDTKLTLNRVEPNLVNQASENGDSFFPGVLLVERLAQIQDLSTVV